MDENAEDFTTESVEEIFDNFEDPFVNVKTSYLQSSLVENNSNFVRPVQYVLATRVAYKNKGSKRQLYVRRMILWFMFPFWTVFNNFFLIQIYQIL
jgi:hypothetical protein